MRAEVSFEYLLEMCMDETTCDIFDINLPKNFVLTAIEVDGSDSSLSHLCSCSITLDGEPVYNGPIGRSGFLMELDSLIPAKSLRITTDCSSLSEWLSDIEPCVLKIKGYYLAYGEPDFEESFIESWG